MKKVSVQCRNIRLSYGSTEVLKNVNLDIEPGEFLPCWGLLVQAKAPCCA